MRRKNHKERNGKIGNGEYERRNPKTSEATNAVYDRRKEKKLLLN